ncbi:MAG: Hsp20/alpha crystallin family protein [Anaerolineae bacterium]|nr:Hsp20/alpha crystallin family protein [Anaerolineae bacterium]
MVNLVRWTPRTDSSLRSFDQMMNDLWQNAWGLRPAASASDTARPVLRPAMDVIEHEESVTVRVDLPGLSPDDVTIEIDGDLLTISGELAESVEEDSDRYHYRERCAGAFKRSLRLADTLDTEHVEATFEHGVLSVVLPKRPEVQPRRIQVETAS